MLKELKEQRAMDRLAIGAFAELCNEVLNRLNRDRSPAAKLTPRAIRYYTQEGLLPAPALEQGQARYGYDHLLRVLAIKLSQNQFIPLRVIRRRLAGRGKTALEQLITDAVLNGVLPVDAVAESGSAKEPRENTMISSRPIFAASLPEIPPQVPLAPPQTAQPLSTWVPVVYDDSHACPEYRVLTRNSLDAAGWEAELNALGREGWWLVQILPQEQQVLLVLMRRTSRA